MKEKCLRLCYKTLEKKKGCWGWGFKTPAPHVRPCPFPKQWPLRLFIVVMLRSCCSCQHGSGVLKQWGDSNWRFKLVSLLGLLACGPRVRPSKCGCLCDGAVGACRVLRGCQRGLKASAAAQHLCPFTTPAVVLPYLESWQQIAWASYNVWTRRLALGVKLQNLGSEDISEGNYAHIVWKVIAQNFLLPFPVFAPSSLQLHSPTSAFRPGISGFLHSVDKCLLRKFPIYFDFLPLYFLLELSVLRVSEGLRLFSQGKLLI